MTARAKLRNRQRHRRASRMHRLAAGSALLPRTTDARNEAWLDWMRACPRWMRRGILFPGPRVWDREDRDRRLAKRNQRGLDIEGFGLKPTAWNRWRPEVRFEEIHENGRTIVFARSRAIGWSRTTVLVLLGLDL